jgi:1-acyl-sn-glycerol-3-phosphate acyltransferase
MVSRILYFICKNSVWIFLKIFWRIKVTGLERVPHSGGFIIAANHRSLVDPPVVGSVLNRNVHFMAKEELFRFGPFGWLISHLNAHPLRRSGDVRAFKLALRLLRSGEGVILFPEGRRSKTDELQKAKPGVGLLAKATGCAVVPAYIHNTGYFKKLKKIRVCFGSALYPDRFESDQALADATMQEIQKMKDHVLAEI